MQKTALEISDARIVVAGPCHPGVLVQIAGQSFEVTRLLTQVVFFIDPLTNALTYGPYKPETERGAASAEK